MKNFSKHFKSLVAMLLAMIMLLGTVLPVVADGASALETGTPGTSGGQTGAGGSGGSETETGSNTPVDTGWYVLEPTENGITVTLHPEKEALLNMSADQLMAILPELIEAFKGIVVDQIKKEMLGEGNSDGWDGVTADSIWETALSRYLTNNYGAATESEYIDFFKDIVGDDAKVDSLADYICDAVWFAYWDGLDAGTLPDGTALSQKLKETFDSYRLDVKTKVKELVVNAIERYIDNNAELPSDADAVDEFVADKLPAYFKDIVDDYLKYSTGEIVDEPALYGFVDSYIKEYIDGYIDDSSALIGDCIDIYLNDIKAYVNGEAALPYFGTEKSPGVFEETEEQMVKNLVISRIDIYFKENLDDLLYDAITDYITARTDGSDTPAVPEGGIYDVIDSIVAEEVKADIRKEIEQAYIDNGFDPADYTNEINAETDNKYASLSEAAFSDYYSDYISEVKLTEGITDADLPAYFLDKAFGSSPDFDYASLVDPDKKSEAVAYAVSEVKAAFAADKNEYLPLVKKIFDNMSADSADFRTVLKEALSKLKNEGKINELVNEYINDAVIDEAILKLLEVDSDSALNSRVDDIIDTVVAKYAQTLTKIEENPSDLDLEQLLKAFTGLTVDDLRTTDNGPLLIFDGSLQMSNLKALLEELPTLGEIAGMEVSKMYVKYAVDISTKFADASFTVTVKMADNCDKCSKDVYDKFRAALKVFNEHVSIKLNGSTLDLDVNVPAVFSDAVLAAIKAGDKIPADLRNKIYSALSGNAGDVYAFWDDLTFDEIITLIDSIDFEGVISDMGDDNQIKALLSKYIDVDNLDNDALVAKAKEFEGHFNTLKNKLSRYVDIAYNRLPSAYKDKTIFDLGLYDGAEGGVAGFSFAKNATITQKMFEEARNKILNLVDSKYPQHLSKVMYILGLFEGVIGTSAGVDISVKVPDIARVTYKIGNTVIKDGFLPAGADPAVYVEDSWQAFEGRDIIAWTYEDGSACTSMPGKDITLVAKLSDVTVNIKADDKFTSTQDGYALVYDGNTYKLVASVASEYINSSNVSISYKWQKDGVDIAEGNEISIEGKADAGKYKVIATLTYTNENFSSVFERSFDVAVTPPEFTVTLTQPSVADPSSQERELTAALAGAPAPATVTYKWYFGSDKTSLAPIQNASGGDKYTAVGNAASGFYRCDAIFTVDGWSFVVESNIVEVSINYVPLDFKLELSQATSGILSVLLSTELTELTGELAPNEYSVEYKWYRGDSQDAVNTYIDAYHNLSSTELSGSGANGYYRCEAIVTGAGQTETFQSNVIEVEIVPPALDITVDISATQKNNDPRYPCEVEAVLGGSHLSYIEGTPTYKWYFAETEGGQEELISSLTHFVINNPDFSGYYRVEVEVTALEQSNKVFSSPVKKITVSALTGDDFNIAINTTQADPKSPCNLETVISGNYMGEIEGAVTYKWFYSKTIGGEEVTLGFTGASIDVSSYKESGYYRVEASFTALNQNIVITETQLVEILPPAPDFSVTAKESKPADFTYTVSAELTGNFDATEYTAEYKWYLADEEVEAFRGMSTVEISGVSASGTYRVEVKVTAYGEEQTVYDEVVIIIEKQVIRLTEIWDYQVFDVSAPYIVYADKNPHSVNIVTAYPVEFSGDFIATAQGEYTATATLTDTENYIFEGELTSVSLDWYVLNRLNLTGTPDPWLGSTEFAYNGSANELKVIIPESLRDFEISYKWYKVVDGENVLIPDATGDTISVTNVSDSGVYKCVVDVTAFGYRQRRSVEFNVKINPAVIDFNDFTWTAPENFTYDGTDHSFTIVSIPDEYKEFITVDYDADTDGIQNNITVKKPGEYTVKVTLALVGNDNYVLSEGDTPTYTLTVSKAQFDFSKITWSYSEPFTFREGTEYSVNVIGYNDFTFGDIVVLYDEDSVNSASAVGVYTAVFAGFKVKDGDEVYALTEYYNAVGSFDAATLSWEIEAEQLPPIIGPEIFEHDEGDVYVKVIDSEGKLSGFTMNVTKATLAFDTISINEITYKLLAAYNIEFNKNGAAPSFGADDSYTVILKIPANSADKELKIVYVDTDGELHELLQSEMSVADGTISFVTKHFSTYAIATEHTDTPVTPPDGPDTPPDTPEGPDTPSDEPIYIEINPLFIAGAVAVALLILILLILIIKKGRRRSKYMKRLIVTEYDETAELYEDLRRYELDVRDTVFIEGERPADAFIDDSPADSPVFASSSLIYPEDRKAELPLGYNGDGTEPPLTQIPTARPKSPAPIVITPDYAVNNNGRNNVVPVTFTDSNGNQQVVSLETAPLVVPVTDADSGNIVMAPVVATIEGTPLAANASAAAETVNEGVINSATAVEATQSAENTEAAAVGEFNGNVETTADNRLIVHSVAVPSSKKAPKSPEELIPEAPIVPKRGEVIHTDEDAPIVIKNNAVKHYEMAAAEAPTIRITKAEPVVEVPAEEPAVEEIVTEEVATQVVPDSEPVSIIFNDSYVPAEPSYDLDNLVPTATRAVKRSATVFLSVEKSESNLAAQEAQEVIEEAIAEEEVIEEPITEEEVIEEPIAEEEVIEEAIAEEEVVEEPIAEEEVIEEPIAEEEVVEEPIAEEEVVEEPAVEEETIEESDDEDDDNDEDDEADEANEASEGLSDLSGQVVSIRYRRSFTSRLIQASDTVKDYYSMIKNAFMSFKGVKARTSWGCETFNKGRLTVGKMAIKGKTLVLCLALDTKEYENTKYHFKDVSDKAKYSKVPMLIKVRSMRSLRYAVDLVGEMMEKKEIELGKLSEEDFRPEYMSTEELIEKNLIKVILPKGVSVDEDSGVVSIDSEAKEEPAEIEEAPAAEIEEAPAAEVEEAPASESEEATE